MTAATTRSAPAPHLPDRRSRRGGRHLDGVTFLTVLLIAALGVQSRLVISPLGGAGSPSVVLSLLALGWWLYFQVQRTRADAWSAQPVRVALITMLTAFAASFVVAMARPIDAIESSSATLGMVIVLAWVGVALVAHDGVPNVERLETLLRRLVLSTTAIALLGIAQFVLQDPIIRWDLVPGLQANLPVGGLQMRSGFTRPAATALHPIEFGAVLTTVLPLAVARIGRGSLGERLKAAACVFIIAMGVVVCGSRSAILCSITGLVVLAAVWSTRTRLVAGAATVVLVLFVALTVPGMTGSLLGLFTGLSEDGSVISRTGSVAIVQEFFDRAPFLGRGYSTFLPSYRILDNQYLLLLVEVGLVGLLCFVFVLVTAFRCALQSRRIATDPVSRERGQALAAAVASALVGFATYDGLSFPMGTSILFLIVGITGANWRLARRESAAPAVAGAARPGGVRDPSRPSTALASPAQEE